MSGLIVALHETKMKCPIIGMLLTSLLAIACGSIYFNEAANAGAGSIIGERNYSYIAGSATSLNVTTSSTSGTSSNAMFVLNIAGIVLWFVVAATNVVFLSVKLLRSRGAFWEVEDKDLDKYSAANRLTVFSSFGLLLVIYYIVASLIMVTNSVVLISLVESPNTLAVFLIGICISLPTKLDSSRQLYGLVALAISWLLALSITVSALVMTVNWRALQDNYFANASMCPSRQIVNALNNNYTFSIEWGGVNRLTYSNRTTWVPQTFADFTCADDALAFALSIYELIMFVLTVNYVCVMWPKKLEVKDGENDRLTEESL